MSSNHLKVLLKQFVPPIFISLFKKNKKYGWKGDYKSWMEAKADSGVYDDKQILEKVKKAVLQVKSGEAVYERDAVLFDSIEYSWPLLTSLLWIATQHAGKLHVADFGGSLGSSFFQNKKFLSCLLELKWNIIEQELFVQCGKEFIQDDTLRFVYTLDQLISEQGMPDVLLFSCVLPYLENPYAVLERLVEYKIPFLIIDNTYFNFEHRDRICVQHVPPIIYDASYPCWFLDYTRVKKILTDTYLLVSEHQNDSFIYLDGKKIKYQGLLLKKEG